MGIKLKNSEEEMLWIMAVANGCSESGWPVAERIDRATGYADLAVEELRRRVTKPGED